MISASELRDLSNKDMIQALATILMLRNERYISFDNYKFEDVTKLAYDLRTLGYKVKFIYDGYIIVDWSE